MGVTMEYKHLNTDEITHNILFLDFDGVCNSYNCGSYVTSDSKTYGIDEKIMPRLKEICVKGNAKIVISSNWRRYGKRGGCQRIKKEEYLENCTLKNIERKKKRKRRSRKKEHQEDA